MAYFDIVSSNLYARISHVQHHIKTETNPACLYFLCDVEHEECICVNLMMIYQTLYLEEDQYLKIRVDARILLRW